MFLLTENENNSIWLAIIIIIMAIYLMYLIYDFLKNNYVRKTGYLYNKVLKLNQESDLQTIKKKLKFTKRYESKSSLDRANLFNVAILIVQENRKQFSDLVKEYSANNNSYNSYLMRYTFIVNEKYEDERILLKKPWFNNYQKYKKRELELCEKIKKKNKNSIKMHLTAYYTSPQGRNHWYKECDYDGEDITTIFNTVKNQEAYRLTAQYQRDIMSNSLRYKILKRDNFRCRVCGASSALDGVRLEVDHIIPVSKGGLTVEENLQTLCERCNRGKSNKY